MVVNPSYFGVKRIGDVRGFRISTNPRSSQQLFFAVKDFDIDAPAVRTAFEKHFRDSSLTAYCIASKEHERPVVIEALFENPIERRKVLKSQHDVVIFTKRDGNPIYATVYTPLPKKTSFRVYTIQRWMLSSIKDMKKDVKEATVRRLESVVRAAEQAKRNQKSKNTAKASKPETVVDIDDASIWEAEADRESAAIKKITEAVKDCAIDTNSIKGLEDCIEDILIPTTSSPYNDGTVTIILNKNASLYSRHISPVGHYLFPGNQKYRLATPSKHYLYCKKCRSLDVHCTSECTI
ncbi:hypothetical protein BJV82DRAFT_674717 [Fennellomyces sp. T-0311]|nr:hypothetical protein BJV82DRAFT_674717 [Fennellomyces sp. T-0311]